MLTKRGIPANIRLDKDVLKTSWRRLSSSSSEEVLKTFSRRLDQAEYVRLSLTSSEDVLVKTNILVFITFYFGCLQDVFKKSSRRLQDVLQRYLQDVFKTYHQVKLFLLTCLWEAFNTFLRHSFPKTILYRGICLSNTTSDKFIVSVQNLQEG